MPQQDEDVNLGDIKHRGSHDDVIDDVHEPANKGTQSTMCVLLGAYRPARGQVEAMR